MSTSEGQAKIDHSGMDPCACRGCGVIQYFLPGTVPDVWLCDMCAFEARYGISCDC